jgi:deoxycytidylate deaminase
MPEGAKFKSGEGLDVCQAIHAEQNALLQCKDVYDIETIYCTVSPCIHCVKLLLNYFCKKYNLWRKIYRL